jgi:type IX secretion system PorP/SprF family membrane protein
MKKILLILIFGIFYGFAYSQQLPIYSQYLYNKFMLNPAVAGADGYSSLNITTRQQWAGLEGAPKINSVSFQSRFIKRGYRINQRKSGKNVLRPQTDGKVGLGGYVYNYRSGLVQRTGFQFSYVYNIWLWRKTQLSLGLGLTGYHFRIMEEDIIFENMEDPVLAGDLKRGIFVPDATFGAYMLNERYSLGFSVDQLLGGAAKFGSSAYSNYTIKRHYYLMGSYSFFFGSENEVQPSFLIKMSEQLKPQMDMGVTYIFDNFKNSFWLGLQYRTINAIIVGAGVRADHLHVGYAFDFSFSQLQKLTYGTHEVSLAFKFGAPQKRFRWLNRYD